MAVTTVSDSPKRGGGWVSERKGPVFELVNRRYRRTQIVITNDINDGPEVILASGTLPTIGNSYTLGNDLDTLAVCIDQQVEPTENPFVWRVVSLYDSARVVDLALSNPLNLPAEVSWDFTNYDFALQRDGAGIPLKNSSGERFDPPVTIEDSRPVLRVSRNEASYNQANAILYQNAVNTDVFGPAQAYQAKITHISGQRMVDIGIVYWKVEYEVEFRWQTFALFLLDQGYRDANGHLFRDPIDWSPLANPTLLNGNGFRQIDTYCQLNLACGINDTQIAVSNPTGYTGGGTPHNYFPPGITPGTPNWYFEVMIDSEIIQCVRSGVNNIWNTVVRGYGGTVQAAHAANTNVYLQPYFLRFLPFKVLPFAPLNLPTS